MTDGRMMMEMSDGLSLYLVRSCWSFFVGGYIPIAVGTGRI